MTKKVEATLIAHADTARVSESVVRAAPAPEFTPTWRPYSHAAVLDCLAAACGELKLQPMRKEYSVTKSLNRLFGVWEIAGVEDEDVRFAVGFRNSTDKHFAVGLCAGERVFVCDNLVFSSEFVLFRMHTGRLTERELTLIATEALQAVRARFDKLREWHNELRLVGLPAQHAALLTVAAMRKELIPPSHYPRFHALYFGDDSKYDQTLHGWHGAITELYSQQSLLTVQRKNSELNRFVDFEANAIIKAAGERRVAFTDISAEAVRKAGEAERRLRAATSDQTRTLRRQLRREARQAERAAAKPHAKEHIITAAGRAAAIKAGKLELPCGMRLRVETPGRVTRVKGRRPANVSPETLTTGKAAKKAADLIRRRWSDDVTPLDKPKDIV